ncbi:hypothetical protein FQZ97_1164500 [compost metagenome]
MANGVAFRLFSDNEPVIEEEVEGEYQRKRGEQLKGLHRCIGVYFHPLCRVWNQRFECLGAACCLNFEAVIESANPRHENVT